MAKYHLNSGNKIQKIKNKVKIQQNIASILESQRYISEISSFLSFFECLKYKFLNRKIVKNFKLANSIVKTIQSLKTALINDNFESDEPLTLTIMTSRVEDKSGYRKTNYSLNFYLALLHPTFDEAEISKGIAEFYNKKSIKIKILNFSDAVDFNDLINVALNLDANKFIFSLNDYTLRILSKEVEAEKIIKFFKHIKYIFQMSSCENLIEEFLLPNRIKIQFINLSVINEQNLKLYVKYFEMFPNNLIQIWVYHCSQGQEELAKILELNHGSIRYRNIPDKIKIVLDSNMVQKY